jgi:hypothetical protein
MRIRVRIDRVVLDGLPLESSERGAFEASLQRALRVGLMVSGAHVPDQSVRERRVVTAPIDIGVHRTPVALGARVGRSVSAAVAQVPRR